MKKDEQQMTYETPEVEAIELRMENAITDSCPSNTCSAVGEGSEICDTDEA